MIQKPNFKKAYILANEMLVASKSITTFPFDVEKVVSEETDLKFCSYKRALEKFGLNCFDLGSDSSVLTKLHGKNIVFYNQDECDVREPFNRLHETGHFLLNHKTDIKEKKIHNESQVVGWKLELFFLYDIFQTFFLLQFVLI